MLKNKIISSYLGWSQLILLTAGGFQAVQAGPTDDPSDEAPYLTPIEKIVFAEVGNPFLEEKMTDSREPIISEFTRSGLIDLLLENHHLKSETSYTAMKFNRHPSIERIAVSEPSLLPTVDKTDKRVLARITLFDYQTGMGSEMISQVFDDNEIETLSHSTLASSGVPATSEEKKAAQELLQRDVPAYRELLQSEISRDSYDFGFFHSGSTDQKSERFGHRVFLVRPVFFGQSFDLPNTIIDLSTDEIVSIEE